MPKFFFDVREGELHTPDQEGTDLAERHLVPGTARGLLLDITRDLKPDADRFEVTVSVRGTDGVAIHLSSLMLKAGWLGLR